jgi:hypothetical protein
MLTTWPWCIGRSADVKQHIIARGDYIVASHGSVEGTASPDGQGIEGQQMDDFADRCAQSEEP